MNPIQGLHHITAIARSPQANIEFYESVLGQRLVKRTINFDDPGTYHLYYGDEIGSPGTILTFFPWPHAVRGTRGTGETTALAYSVPESSLDFWAARLDNLGVEGLQQTTRFGTSLIEMDDPDGMRVELVGIDQSGEVRHWNGGPIPSEHALCGFHGVTLRLTTVDATASLLTEQLGFSQVDREGSVERYRAASNLGAFVDLDLRPDEGRGRFGAGSIHHIAFRAADDNEQAAYLETLRAAGRQVTPVQDRQYFRSIYFREPGGVLFEIATDGPGFTLDESVEDLGSSLKLPPWHEPRRDQIEARLPSLARPART